MIKKTVWITCVTLLLVTSVGWAAISRLQQAEVTELWQPEPPVVVAEQGQVPSDAIVLLGEDLSAWRHGSGDPAQWHMDEGVATVKAGTGDIFTKDSFESVQLHVEWRSPTEIEGEGQGRGNSGVFLMQHYEVQVLDSYQNPTYANGQAASVYKQHIPLVNASRSPGEWQSYDIIFMAPVFDSAGRIRRPATLTVLHNGVLVQNNVSVQGPTEFIGEPNYDAHGPLPIKLQDHSNPVSYRNIWVRRL